MYRNAGFAPGGMQRDVRYALIYQKFNPSFEIHGSLEGDSEISRIASGEISALVKRL